MPTLGDYLKSQLQSAKAAAFEDGSLSHKDFLVACRDTLVASIKVDKAREVLPIDGSENVLYTQVAQTEIAPEE